MRRFRAKSLACMVRGAIRSGRSAEGAALAGWGLRRVNRIGGSPVQSRSGAEARGNGARPRMGSGVPLGATGSTHLNHNDPGRGKQPRRTTMRVACSPLGLKRREAVARPGNGARARPFVRRVHCAACALLALSPTRSDVGRSRVRLTLGGVLRPAGWASGSAPCGREGELSPCSFQKPRALLQPRQIREAPLRSPAGPGITGSPGRWRELRAGGDSPGLSERARRPRGRRAPASFMA